MNKHTLWPGIIILVAAIALWLHGFKTPMEGKETMIIPAVDILGRPGDGPSYDKSSDTLLQRMITEVAPRFKQHTFHDILTGDSIEYNLFRPDIPEDQKVPLVLFMADASTPGRGVSAPLLQGYGALVWAAPEWQDAHPCIVLVPQFYGRAVNDEFQHSTQVDALMRLLDDVANTLPVDCRRIYATGQSMGGMITMYLASTYPGVFAALMPVDSHWEPSSFERTARYPIVFFTAGGNAKSQGGARNLRLYANEEGVKTDTIILNARTPLPAQNERVAKMLAQGAPVNIITFQTGTVLPAGDKGNEHMHSFDAAYRLTAPREWMFQQHK